MQLTNHLTSNHLKHKFQSAYRAGHSTETALLHIVSDILTASYTNQVSILTLVDLSAAFDTIGHSILLKCLEQHFWCLWSGPQLVQVIPVKQVSVCFRKRQ